MKEKCIYTKFAPERNKQFAVQTSIVVCDGIKYVKKTAMYSEAEQHIKAMVENCNILTDIYGKDCVAQCIHSTSSEMYMEYVSGETLSVILENLLSEKQYDEFYDLVNKYVLFIKKSCSDFCDLNNEYNFDFMSPNRITNIDFIFDNIIVRNGEFVIIDYEWLVSKIDYKYVLYRAVNIFSLRSKDYIKRNILSYIEKKYKLLEYSSHKGLDEMIYFHVFNDLLEKYRKNITTFSNSCISINKPGLFVSKTDKYTQDGYIPLEALIENNVVKLKIIPCKYGIESRFRFDPLEGGYCEFELLKIDTDAFEYKVMPLNASVSERNKYIFLTNDPIIEFLGDFKNVKYFDIHYKVRVLNIKEVINIALEKLNIALEKLNERDFKLAMYKNDSITYQKELYRIKSSRGYKALEKVREIKGKFLLN